MKQGRPCIEPRAIVTFASASPAENRSIPPRPGQPERQVGVPGDSEETKGAASFETCAVEWSQGPSGSAGFMPGAKEKRSVPRRGVTTRPSLSRTEGGSRPRERIKHRRKTNVHRVGRQHTSIRAARTSEVDQRVTVQEFAKRDLENDRPT